jgi:hypothetical protein
MEDNTRTKTIMVAGREIVLHCPRRRELVFRPEATQSDHESARGADRKILNKAKRYFRSRVGMQ